MKRQKIFSVVLVFIFVLVSFRVTAEDSRTSPVAVSPGSDSEVASIWQSCPTFSWSAVDQASSYRIAVFEVVEPKVMGYESMAAMISPVINKDIPGPALSWTLSSEESLKTGNMYSWYVQAVDDYGNNMGNWSGGKIFKVEQEIHFAGIEEKLAEKMREYGVNEETITGILKDMESEVKEVAIRNSSSKSNIINNQGISGIKGYEGPTNTFYGLTAGASNTTGNYNSFFGSATGATNSIGSWNTFVGYNAGINNTSGNENTFLGFNSGYTNITGYHNTFLGSQAGLSNTTGRENTFIGYVAGYSNIFGEHNTFLGSTAGFYNTTGSHNTFIGAQTGTYNTSGYRNTFTGKEAGNSNTTGRENTFLGYKAGYNNTYGYTNTFLGSQAGLSNTTGYWNTFIGDLSGTNNVTGSSNTFCGRDSGKLNTTGYGNTFIGTDTGYDNTQGYNNTFIGCLAGANNSTGNSNVFIGYYSGYYETGSHKLYIDNYIDSFPLIYGEFDNGIVAINGKLGIGTQTPYHPLHMASGAYCSTGGTWTNASSRSLKENIQALSTGEAVETLNKLTPVKYNYKVDKTDRHVGFIAEDAPELVATKDRKGMSSMDVVAVLTKVVQEQQKTIAELKEKIESFEKK